MTVLMAEADEPFGVAVSSGLRGAAFAVNVAAAAGFWLETVGGREVMSSARCSRVPAGRPCSGGSAWPAALPATPSMTELADST